MFLARPPSDPNTARDWRGNASLPPQTISNKNKLVNAVFGHDGRLSTRRKCQHNIRSHCPWQPIARLSFAFRTRAGFSTGRWRPCETRSLRFSSMSGAHGELLHMKNAMRFHRTSARVQQGAWATPSVLMPSVSVQLRPFSPFPSTPASTAAPASPPSPLPPCLPFPCRRARWRERRPRLSS